MEAETITLPGPRVRCPKCWTRQAGERTRESLTVFCLNCGGRRFTREQERALIQKHKDAQNERPKR